MRIFTRLSAEYFFAIFLWKPIDFYLQDSIMTNYGGFCKPFIPKSLTKMSIGKVDNIL